MTRPEYTGVRDLSYSAWHRAKLSSRCYAMNLDWIEFRRNPADVNNPRIVAVMEEKDDRASEYKEWNKSIIKQIAAGVNAPAYLVYHNGPRRKDDEPWLFRVINLTTDELSVMNEDEYKQFIEAL